MTEVGESNDNIGIACDCLILISEFVASSWTEGMPQNFDSNSGLSRPPEKYVTESTGTR